MQLYKYLHSDRIDVLANSRIRFTQAAALNDPFESYPSGMTLEKSLIDYIISNLLTDGMIPQKRTDIGTQQHARKFVENSIQSSRYDYGFLSLSENRNELLMWSHYCDSHKGFVVGFNGDHNYFQDRTRNWMASPVPVAYSAIRPSLPKIKDWGVLNVAESVLLTKSEHWRYEKEWRMVAELKYASETIGVEKANRVCLFDFPSDCVTEIILGCQMDKLKQSEIREVLKDKYPLAKLYQARLSDTKFDIDINEVKITSYS